MFTARYGLNLYIYIWMYSGSFSSSKVRMQYSTNSPYSSSSACCTHRKDKLANPGNLPKISALLDVSSMRQESTFAFFLSVNGQTVRHVGHTREHQCGLFALTANICSSARATRTDLNFGLWSRNRCNSVVIIQVEANCHDVGSES